MGTGGLVRFVFEVDGDKLIDRELLRLGNRAIDARPAFVAIADLMISETGEQFASEGRHASGGWKPLKEATLDRKRRKGLRLEILQETGALLSSLTQLGDGNMVLQIQSDSLTYGSKLPYAGAHQNPRPGSPLPRRRPLEFTEATKRRMVKIIQRYVVTGLAPA